MKSVLMSIQPKWCELIALGKKTVEVRKTKPKTETPFKVYIYCTKNKEKLIDVIHDGDDMGDFIHRGKPNFIKAYKDLSLYGLFNGGKVIGEFVCNEITVAERGSYCVLPKSKTMLDELDLLEYADEKTVYGWHISDLVIYDKPKELNEFRTLCQRQYKDCRKCGYFHSAGSESTGFFESCCFDGVIPLTRPPQSWCYVESEGED